MRLQGKLIKHDTMKDVYFDVYKVMELPHKFVLKGKWFNLGFTESYDLNVHQTIKISKSNIKQWMYCVTPLDKCLRYSEWVYCD